MQVHVREHEVDGLGTPDRLVVVGGETHVISEDKKEFWTNLSLEFSPPPEEDEGVLTGRLAFPETANFEFRGTLDDLKSLIEKSTHWRDVVKDPRVDCWR